MAKKVAKKATKKRRKIYMLRAKNDPKADADIKADAPERPTRCVEGEGLEHPGGNWEEVTKAELEQAKADTDGGYQTYKAKQPVPEEPKSMRKRIDELEARVKALEP